MPPSAVRASVPKAHTQRVNNDSKLLLCSTFYWPSFLFAGNYLFKRFYWILLGTAWCFVGIIEGLLINLNVKCVTYGQYVSSNL